MRWKDRIEKGAGIVRRRVAEEAEARLTPEKAAKVNALAERAGERATRIAGRIDERRDTEDYDAKKDPGARRALSLARTALENAPVKGALRFVPLANVGIAAADVRRAARMLEDPTVSTAAANRALARALLSTAAVAPLPGLSQIFAAGASGVKGWEFYEDFVREPSGTAAAQDAAVPVSGETLAAAPSDAPPSAPSV